MRREMTAVFIILGLTLATSTQAQDRYPQTLNNYQAVRSGAKQLGDLTAQELADVAELDRSLRAQKPDNRTPSQRCVAAEVKRAGGSVTELERRVIDMKCREAGD